MRIDLHQSFSRGFVVTFAAAAALALAAPDAAADQRCVKDALGNQSCFATSSDGYEAEREANGSVDHVNQSSSDGQAPSSYSVDRWAPACSGNGPFGGDMICMAAMTCTEGPEYLRYFHWVVTYRRPNNNVESVVQRVSECRSAPPAGAGGVVTPALVAREFARLPLPATTVIVEPVPTTLVNFATGFSTDAGEQTFTLTLLGQRVGVRAVPETFVYNFGDGERLGPTTERGSRYPSPSLTHTYSTAGQVTASVSVTYRGWFQVSGGAWLPVPGTVTIDGLGVPLRVREAKAQLVSS